MFQKVSRTLAFALFIANTFGTLPVSGQKDVKVIVGLRLYRKIAEANPEKNLLYSPMAVSQAMRMIYLGSDGATKSQIEAVMQLSEREKKDPASRYFRFNEYNTMEKFGPLTARFSLLTANRVYGPAESAFKESYVDWIDEEYGEWPARADFRANAEQARQRINSYVASKTQQKIPEVYPTGSISNNSKLVLVSGFAFRASWQYAFDDKDISPQAFHLSNGLNINVPMLRCGPNSENGYVNNTRWGYEVLKLSFRDQRENMFFVLPHRNQTLAAVERLLETSREKGMVIGIKNALMNIAIPKFQFEQTHELREALQEVGVVDAFDEAKANFAKLSSSAGLVLTRLTHKSVIAADEIGSGSRTTHPGGKCSKKISPKVPIDFVLDRPFLFLVLDVTTRTVIFRGRVLNPLETK